MGDVPGQQCKPRRRDLHVLLFIYLFAHGISWRPPPRTLFVPLPQPFQNAGRHSPAAKVPEVQYFVAFALNRRNVGSDRSRALEICERSVRFVMSRNASKADMTCQHLSAEPFRRCLRTQRSYLQRQGGSTFFVTFIWPVLWLLVLCVLMSLVLLGCLRLVLQFIESIESGGTKDYESCEAAISSYRMVFAMEESLYGGVNLLSLMFASEKYEERQSEIENIW